MTVAALRPKLKLTLLVVALVSAPMLVKGLCLLRTPEHCLYLDDAQMFLGSGEAADFLIAEARRGPLAVFTDVIWGAPADAVFVYLNARFGIQVHEAWWTTSPDYPILPSAPVEPLKSQYERVPAGILDPRRLGRVYYVTETADKSAPLRAEAPALGPTRGRLCQAQRPQLDRGLPPAVDRGAGFSKAPGERRVELECDRSVVSRAVCCQRGRLQL